MKKLTIAVFTFLLVTIQLVAAPVAFAQSADEICKNTGPIGEWWEPSFCQFAGKVGTDAAKGGSPATEIFGERYTYAQVSWILNSLVAIVGGDVAKCAATPGGNIIDCIRSNIVQGGGGPVLTMLTLSDRIQSSRPASGIQYVASKLDKFHLVSPAYAQSSGGYGFTKSLLPIQPLWAATRNAAFAMTTFAIIVLAFMIMFRAKISPQAVISAQSALPKVAIGLIFITFSYAIAGLLVDLAFVVQGVIAAVVAASGISAVDPITIFNNMQDGNGGLTKYGLAFMFESLGGGGLLGKIVVLPGNFALAIFSMLDTISSFIVLALILIGAARILWLLIQTYAKIIFLVVGSPFIALMSIVGTGGGISGWIKKLAAELGVFVAIGVLIMFAHILFYSFGNGQNAVQGLASILNLNPYGIKIPTDLQGAGFMPSGFSFGNNTATVGLFVSLAVILSIPKLASSLRDQIATGRGSYGLGVGQAFSPATGLAQAGLKQQMSVQEAVARAAGRSPYQGPGGMGYSVRQGASWLLGKVK